jgi:hypothetical protein
MNKKFVKILIKPTLKRKSKNRKTIKKSPTKTNKNKKNNNPKKRVSLKTNVESGYSATSFPFVFVRKNPYNLKNNNNKKKKNSFRTTALVAPLLHK